MLVVLAGQLVPVPDVVHAAVLEPVPVPAPVPALAVPVDEFVEPAAEPAAEPAVELALVALPLSAAEIVDSVFP